MASNTPQKTAPSRAVRESAPTTSYEDLFRMILDPRCDGRGPGSDPEASRLRQQGAAGDVRTSAVKAIVEAEAAARREKTARLRAARAGIKGPRLPK